MCFYQKLESVFFFFGFQECKKTNSLNFLKLAEYDYLLMRVSKKTENADLIHAKYQSDNHLCDSEPYWEKSIKLSFSPDSDTSIIRDFIEKYKKI
jgi:hypothetical protein